MHRAKRTVAHTVANEVLGRTLGFAVFTKTWSTGECMVCSMGGGEDATGFDERVTQATHAGMSS